MKKIIAGLLMISLLGACGWQLRGSSSESARTLDSIYISSENNHGPFVTQLQQSLRSDKVAVLDDATLATLRLFLLEETSDRRTAAVGSDALTSAYELTLTVDYEIRTPNGELVNSPNSASVSRTFNYSAGGANSGVREEGLVLSEMRRELARTLIRRLHAIAERAASVSPATAQDNAPNGQTAP